MQIPTGTAAAAGIMISVSHNSTVWLISGIMCGIGAGGGGLFKNTALREMPATVRALAVGSFAMAQDSVSIFSSAVFGTTVDVLGYSQTFMIVAVLPIVGAVLTLLFYEKSLARMSGEKVENP